MVGFVVLYHFKMMYSLEAQEQILTSGAIIFFFILTAYCTAILKYPLPVLTLNDN